MSILRVKPVELTRIFVYGTLKRGEHNEYIGEKLGLVYSHSAALHGYKIKVYAWVPLLALCSYGTVEGEVWTIPTRRLSKLDEFEIPEWYKRELVTLVGGEKAYAYVGRIG